jgi:perosamine synthetase
MAMRPVRQTAAGESVALRRAVGVPASPAGSPAPKVARAAGPEGLGSTPGESFPPASAAADSLPGGGTPVEVTPARATQPHPAEREPEGTADGDRERLPAAPAGAAPDLLPLSRPCLGVEEAAAVARVLASGWVSQGPEVAAFEQELAAAVGALDACAVASGTAALQLALLAVGVRPGDEVVTVSSSFIATANAIRHCGATPVFVDVEPATGNLDPELLDAACGPRTRAVLVVHQLGLPCDLAAVGAVTARRGLALIEDAACALGSEVRGADGRWERIGRPHGDLACFSFHGRKVLTTGEGGAVTTADPELAGRLRRLREHGMDRSAAERHRARTVAIERYLELGFNFRMSDLAAAVGRVQLGRLPAIVARRRALAARYDAAFLALAAAGGPHFAPLAEPAWARSNRQSYAVRLPAGCDQRATMQRLLDQGIATRPGVMCCHREEAYPPGSWRCGASADERQRAGCAAGGRCPHLAASEELRDRSILLPLFPDLADADVDRVVAALARG